MTHDRSFLIHLLLPAVLAAALTAASTNAAAAPRPRPGKTAPPADDAAAAAQRRELDRLAAEYKALDGRRAWFAALKIARRALALQIALSGPDAEATQDWRYRLANALYLTGDHMGAVVLHQQRLAALENRHGRESREALIAHEDVLRSYPQDRYEDRLAVMQRILALTHKRHGERSIQYADALATHGNILHQRGDFAARVPILEQRLQILEVLSASPGRPGGDDLVQPLLDLATGYWLARQHARAIATFERARALSDTSSRSAVDRANVLWSIVATYLHGRRDDLIAPIAGQAAALYQSEIDRMTRANPDDPALAGMLGYLANHVQRSGDIARAEQLLERAYALGKKRGESSIHASALADIKRRQGKPKEALALYEDAQAESRTAAPHTAFTYNWFIADVARELGDHARAERLLLEYVAHAEKTWGRDSYMYAITEQSLAHHYMVTGKPARAEPLLVHDFEIAERELTTALRTGTEADHAAAVGRYSHLIDTAVNYQRVYAPHSGSASRLGLTALLRQKGRALDAATADLASVRAQLSPVDRLILDELAAARAQLARLTLAGPSAAGGDAEFAREVAAYTDKITKLEVQIASKSAAYRVQRQPITLAGVQKLVPRDTRLVEIINYQPFNPGAPYTQLHVLPPRAYAAYVLGAAGDPVFVDLGPATAIDLAVEQFGAAIADPDNDRAVELGRQLHALTFAKLAPALGTATQVLIAPDGALNVVPFAALVDDKGQFLVKRFTFTYLTSGRDLLRLGLSARPRSGAAIFADPAFDGGAPKASPTPTRGRRSVEQVQQDWQQLPGTGQEAEAIARHLRGVTVYRGAAATEAELKAVRGPRILHLATHGFFLRDEPRTPSSPAANSVQAEAHENPLLRSGLAFAGANQLRSGDDDGILTALEAAGLDLWGTQLVVLSACETGVGKVTNGDGVYGLRRALVLAGAESLLMSLWQVDDTATRDLMVGYYARLAGGSPRSSALRDVQLELQRDPRYSHPYFWASFLPAGANTPLP